MSGIKQFLLEFSNFLVNMVFMVVIMIVGNFFYFDVFEYSQKAVKFFNIALAIIFFLCLLLQNIFFRSLFYVIARYKFKCKKNEKIKILCHNLLFNFIIIGTIVVEVCEIPFGIKSIFIGLFLLELIPCFIKKYSKSLSFYIFRIDTIKKSKESRD